MKAPGSFNGEVDDGLNVSRMRQRVCVVGSIRQAVSRAKEIHRRCLFSRSRIRKFKRGGSALSNGEQCRKTQTQKESRCDMIGMTIFIKFCNNRVTKIRSVSVTSVNKLIKVAYFRQPLHLTTDNDDDDRITNIIVLFHCARTPL